jgi:putative aldouronate transport system substrate-binding protein
MYRFANEDPNQSGKKDTYGMSTTMIGALLGAYGSYTGFTEGAAEWSEENGALIINDVRPENKEALEIAAQMYADGVLHPEFITGENEGGYWALSHHLINGEIGVSCLASIDHYRYVDVTGEAGACMKEYQAVNGEDQTVVYGPWPAGPNGDYGWRLGFGTGIGENAVYNASLNDDPEKLAVIFKIMDIFNTDDELAMMAQFGKEGETYEMTGSADMPGMKFILTNEELNALGVMAYRSLCGANSPYNETVFEMNFANNPTVANRLTIMEQPQFESKIVNALPISLPSINDYKQELITYRDETWINMITGELSIDYWDTYVEEYMALGGDVLTQEANDWYNNK